MNTRIGTFASAILMVGCGSPGIPGAVAPDEIPTPAPSLTPVPKQPVTGRTMTSMPFEKFSKTKNGDTADFVNLIFVGSELQIQVAAKKGGWLGADPINAWNSLKMVSAALRHTPYPTAPMTALFMFGRDQDIALQIPTDDVAVRDHFRLWETGIKDKLARPVWVGAGTKDVAIKLEPGTNKTSHQIDPKIDLEREIIVGSFERTGLIAASYKLPGYGPHEGMNGTGDRFFTDGQVAVLEVEDFAVPDPKKKK